MTSFKSNSGPDGKGAMTDALANLSRRLNTTTQTRPSFERVANTGDATMKTNPFPAKWTKFENTAENRARFVKDENYLIRWKNAAGIREDDCFVHSVGTGLNVLVAPGLDYTIPFWAIRQVKNIS